MAIIELRVGDPGMHLRPQPNSLLLTGGSVAGSPLDPAQDFEYHDEASVGIDPGGTQDPICKFQRFDLPSCHCAPRSPKLANCFRDRNCAVAVCADFLWSPAISPTKPICINVVVVTGFERVRIQLPVPPRLILPFGTRISLPKAVRVPGRSFGTTTVNDHLGGFEKNRQVQYKRHMLDIEEVILQLHPRLLDAPSILIFDLSPARYPRAHRVPQ
jgi:hypothetical protein